MGWSSIYDNALTLALAATNGNPPAIPAPSLNNALVAQARLGGSSSEVWQVSYGPPAWLTSGTRSRAFAPFDPAAAVATGASCPGSCPGGVCPAQCPPTWVVGTITLTALQLGQPQQLRNFPMDSQPMNLVLVNKAAANALTGRDVLFRFTDDAVASALPAAGDPDGYTITSVALGNATTPEGLGSIQVQWMLRRIPDFFVNRFIMPMSLVTVGVIMLLGANPAARAMASFTMTGTVVSFLFVSGQSVPQLPYRTRLDNYFSLHFFMAFIMGLYNVYTTNRIDRVKADPWESAVTLCGLLAPAAKAEERREEDRGGRKEVVLTIKAAPEGSSSSSSPAEAAAAAQLALLQRMYEAQVEEYKKNDAVKAAAKKSSDAEKARAAQALHNDQLFMLLLLGVYALVVPCLFYL